MGLIGRATEVRDLTMLVRAHRVVTVVGPGGVGKTRLVADVLARAGSRSNRRQLWIDLSATNRGGVRSLWRTAIAARDLARLDDDNLARATGRLGDVLVVVDNCEHVIEEASELIEMIALRCPQITLLATSRQPLEIPGETTLRLGPLTVPERDSTSIADLERCGAGALFLERSRQVEPSLVCSQRDVAAIASLCVLLDGNPLAILLAGARVATLSPVALLAALQRSNEVLSQTSERGARRHHSVGASIRWSYDLLDPPAQSVLGNLAVFPATFDLATGAPVATDTGGSVDETAVMITRLVDVGLVQRSGDATYRLHFTVRQLLLNVHHPDECERARSRHATNAIAWAIERTTWASQYTDSIVERTADLDVALTWAMVHDPSLMCRAMATFVVVLSVHHDIGRFCDWLLTTSCRDANWVRALAQLSFASWGGGGHRLAPVLPVVADIATTRGDEHVLRLLDVSTVAGSASAGDLRPSATLLAAARAAGDSFVAMIVGTATSLAASLYGRHDHARVVFATTRWACADGRVDYTITAAHAAESLVLRQQGEIDAAIRTLRATHGIGTVHETVQFCQTLVALDRGDTNRLATLHTEVGDGHWARYLRPLVAWGLATAVQDWPTAIDHATACLAATDHNRALELEPLLGLGAAHVWLGHRTPVANLIERLTAFADGLPEPLPYLDARLALLRAQARLMNDAITDAERDARTALEHAVNHHLVLVIVDTLETLATVATRRGNTRLAARLLGACDAQRTRIGYTSRLHSRTTITALAGLPAFAEGHALNLDAAVALARRSRGARRRPSHGRDSLTPTETSVAQLVAAGRTNNEVATALLISPATVKTHLTRIFAKLNVANRTQLALRLQDPDRTATNVPAND